MKNLAEPTADVVLDVAPPLPGRNAVGTLTNRGTEAIEFAAYGSRGEGEAAWTEPLAALIHLDRFVPQNGWQSVGLGYCGTGVASYRLEPGRSVSLLLHPGDGSSEFLRFRLSYQLPDREEQKGKNVCEAISKAVQVPQRR